MRLSWKRSRTTCSIQWIHVSRTSRQGLLSRNFQSQTRPFLNWLSLKTIQQKTLLATRPSKGWPWKWMICSLSKTISSQSGACQLRRNSRFWILTGLTTAVIRLLRLSWNTSTFQLLNFKSNCSQPMTSILPCVMSWGVLKNRKPWWIWRLFSVVMSVLMGVWMIWKYQTKSMLAQSKSKWTLMVWKSHGSSCSKMKPTTTQRKLSHLVARLLVSVVPFVTHCQDVHTFIKPCVFQVRVILQHRFRKRVLGNCHNKSFLKQRLMVILHMVTRLGLRRPTFVNTSTQAL